MAASMTTLPVLGVPVESKALKGMDSLLSIVQMPGGVPVATFAIGQAGAKNAGLHAAAVLALGDAATGQAARGLARAAHRIRGREPRPTRNDIHETSRRARSAGRHDRHSGRRTARPHAGDGRRAAGSQDPHLFGQRRTRRPFRSATAYTVAGYDDREALAAFAEACDAVTYEFENVPAEAAAILSEHKPTNPNAHALAIAQDRLEEKSFVRDLGLDDGAIRQCGNGGRRARRLCRAGRRTGGAQDAAPGL